MVRAIKNLKYWFELHTMHPLSWPYALVKSLHYKLTDLLSPKR